MPSSGLRQDETQRAVERGLRHAIQAYQDFPVIQRKLAGAHIEAHEDLPVLLKITHNVCKDGLRRIEYNTQMLERAIRAEKNPDWYVCGLIQAHIGTLLPAWLEPDTPRLAPKQNGLEILLDRVG